METRQLKYFVAVAEELHFGRAARRLNISQPPLSQQIMKFEDELGVKLFRRNKRSVSLTAPGKSLLGNAGEILRAIEQAKSDVLETASGRSGQIRIGYVGPALDTILPEAIRRFKERYPKVGLTLREMFTNAQLQAVRKSELDVGAVRLFRHDVSDLDYQTFHRESYALAVPEGHAMAGRACVDISELKGESFVFYPRESQPLLYDEWMKVFAEAGFTPDIVQETARKTAAAALVAAGIGISIVPENMALHSPPGVVLKPLSGRCPHIELHLVFKGGNDSPAVTNFVQVVRDIT